MPTVHSVILDNHLQVEQVMQRLLGPEFSPAVAPLISADYRVGVVPFDKALWAFDPAPISQIKKIINALYHLEQIALLVDADMALGDASFSEIMRRIPAILYQDIPGLQDHVYQILHLLTHVDVEFSDLFQQELSVLIPLIPSVHATATMHFTNNRHLNVAHQVGEGSGHGVRHLSQMSYTFLTQLGLLLPDYLAHMQAYVESCAINPPPPGDHMDAPALLRWFEGLQFQGVNLSSHYLYQRYFRPLLALQTEILNELAHLNASSVHVIQEKLMQLKEHFSTVVSCVDELEIALMLRPGLLSEPLTQMADAFHQRVVYHCIARGIDWVIDNAMQERRDSERRSQAIRRHADVDFSLEQLDEVEAASRLFFNTLDANRQSTRLSQLNAAVKSELISSFRLIQPHLAVVDIKSSNAIVSGLLAPNEDGIFNLLLDWTARQDQLQAILNIGDALRAHLLKERQTLLLRQRMNRDLLDSLGDDPESLFWVFDYPAVVNACRAQQANTLPALLDTALIPDLEAEKRASRVLKSTIYSTTVSHLRAWFVSNIDALSLAAQEQLKGARNNTGSLPFPEIHVGLPTLRGSIENLKQAHALLPFKQVANALYFLEKSCNRLESLDNRSMKIVYIKESIECAHYAYQAVQLLKTLSTDFHAQRARELFTSIRDPAQAQLFALQRDYQPGDPDILFAIVNALTLLPDHLRAGREGCSPEVVASAQANARAVADEMNRVLASNGAWALFCETPAAVGLFRTLRARLDVFLSEARSSHATIVDLVGFLHRDVLIPLVLGADQWEESLNLRAGYLSGPMKQMLDAYYQGILKALTLPTARRVALVTGTDDFVRRIDEANARYAVAGNCQFELCEIEEEIDAFRNQLTDYTSVDGDVQDALAQSFSTTILPLLNDATPACHAAYLQVDLGVPLMEWLSPENSAHRMAMDSLLRLKLGDLKGQMASHQLARDSAVEKAGYLEAQLLEQVRLNIAFKRDCIVQSLHRQAMAFKGVSAEYDQALLIFVQALEPNVFNLVERLEDMDAAILTILNENMQTFEAEQGIYYRQMVKIKQAIDQMNAYMVAQQAQLYLNAHEGLSSGFESQTTLNAKRLLIEEMEAVITQALPIQERMRAIHGIIERDGFKTDLLAYDQYDALTYGWLVQSVTLFFEWIGFYKPEPKVVYERLKAEIGFFRPPMAAAVAAPQGPALAVVV